MRFEIESERSFWFLAVWVFVFLVAATYFPVFLGKILFPRDMVLQFPRWAGFKASGSAQRYADIGDLI